MRDALIKLGLSDAAVNFLCDLYLVIQAWDDFYDGDDMPREHKLLAIWASLVGIPSNPFFQRHSSFLLPILSGMVLKWESANQLERDRDRLDISLVWRAGFLDVILQSVLLEQGPERAMSAGPTIARMYDETIESLREEFNHA